MNVDQRQIGTDMNAIGTSVLAREPAVLHVFGVRSPLADETVWDSPLV